MTVVTKWSSVTVTDYLDTSYRAIVGHEAQLRLMRVITGDRARDELRSPPAIRSRTPSACKRLIAGSGHRLSRPGSWWPLGSTGRSPTSAHPTASRRQPGRWHVPRRIAGGFRRHDGRRICPNRNGVRFTHEAWVHLHPGSLRRTNAQSRHALGVNPQGTVSRANRRPGSGDNQPAGVGRRNPEVGLPLLLATRCRDDGRHVDLGSTEEADAFMKRQGHPRKRCGSRTSPPALCARWFHPRPQRRSWTPCPGTCRKPPSPNRQRRPGPGPARCLWAYLRDGR